MARYLQQKYVGTYRVIAEHCRNTNDFPRVVDGSKEGQIDPSFDDIFIKCKSNSQIYHIGRNNLQAYLPSLQRGRRLLKELYTQLIGDVEPIKYDYDKIYKALTDNGMVFNITETDEEVLFDFKANNIETIATLLQAKTNGASISPFSTKNLERAKYDIPEEDLALYKEITTSIPKDNMRMYLKLNNGFMDTLTTKKYKLDDVKADMKKSGLKSKEYFHSIGKWNEYTAYLQKQLQEKLN